MMPRGQCFRASTLQLGAEWGLRGYGPGAVIGCVTMIRGEFLEILSGTSVETLWLNGLGVHLVLDQSKPCML